MTFVIDIENVQLFTNYILNCALNNLMRNYSSEQWCIEI